jgi:hypothetical protein
MTSYLIPTDKITTLKIFKLGINKLTIGQDIKVPAIGYIYETKKPVTISQDTTKLNNYTSDTFKQFKTNLKRFKTVSINGLGLIVGKILITQKYNNESYRIQAFSDTFNYVEPKYVKVPVRFIMLKDDQIKLINHHASLPF